MHDADDPRTNERQWWERERAQPARSRDRGDDDARPGLQDPLSLGLGLLF